MDSWPIRNGDIQSLAPNRLANRNPHRYQGEKERVTLAAFAAEDSTQLARAYATLLVLYETLKPVYADPAACRQVLQAFVTSPEYRELAVLMSHLGHATAAAKNREVDRLVHDLRGGAYQALSFRLQLFELVPDREAGLQSVYFLVRDHLKIMRNCVADLDPERFAADAGAVDHDADLLVEKWSQPDFSADQSPVRIDLRCQLSGTICESCLEFSSLDRIIYNLINNASRFTVDGAVLFCIAGVPIEAPRMTRLVVANAVAPGHAEELRERFGDRPGELFRGGFTTGGHGVGLRICADFCAHAFGLSDFDEALHAGYFGARWFDDVLAVWFHWPLFIE